MLKYPHRYRFAVALYATATCLLSACQPVLPALGEPVTGREWVAASARVHDPAGLWSLFAAGVIVSSVGEDGRLAFSEDLYIDRGADTFRRAIASRQARLTQTAGPGGCRARWPGAVQPTDDELARNGLNGEPCAVILPRRALHEFLIGLPMSALTPAARFSESSRVVDAFGQVAARVDLSFVGDADGESWQLFIDPDTEVLVGAAFFSARGGGERISYEDYRDFGGYRLARRRVVTEAFADRFVIEQRLRFEAIPD